MSEEPVFPRKVLLGWIIAAVLAFACSLYFMGNPGDPGAEAPAASVFSRSALGYAGIADILEKLGEKVVRSQGETPARPAGHTVSIIAEPHFGLDAPDALRALHEADAVLLVLPKWHGKPDPAHRGWIADAAVVSEFEAAWALALGIEGGKLVRGGVVDRWSDNALGVDPDIAEPVQLVQADGLKPIVASADGVLVGEVRAAERRVWILSDPDVMANHGIGQNDNAAFAVALIQALRGGDGTIVFEDTTHGLLGRAAKAALPALPSNPLKLPFDARFLPATLQGGLTIVLLLWAAVMRFGAPVPAPPPLDAGKRGLIQNAARLIAFAGYQRVIAKRYVEATIREVGRQIHAPRGLADSGLVDWLGRVGEARGVDRDCALVYRQTRTLDQGRGRGGDLSSVMPLLRDIYRWKQEMIDGPSRNPRDHRGRAPRGAQSGDRPG
jgi:hypothetical protein